MIQNKELMFGNIIGRQYVNPNPKGQSLEIEPCIVCDIKETSILVTVGLNDNLKMRLNNELLFPITTNEYWLTKLGFQKQSKKNHDYKHKKYSYLRVCLCGDNRHRLITRMADELTEEPICEFVHQLQNLFFCLTHEKLECLS